MRFRSLFPSSERRRGKPSTPDAGQLGGRFGPRRTVLFSESYADSGSYGIDHSPWKLT